MPMDASEADSSLTAVFKSGRTQGRGGEGYAEMSPHETLGMNMYAHIFKHTHSYPQNSSTGD